MVGVAKRSAARMAATVAVLVASMLAALLTAPSAAAAESPSGQPASRGYLFDQALLYLVNDARRHAGVPLVHSDSGLAYLASFWSVQLASGATGGQLVHNLDAPSMLPQVGAGSASRWAENIQVFDATVTPREVFDNYMSSPVHRGNILNPNYRYFGSGSVAAAGDVAIYNTMEFTDKVDPGGCHPFPDVDATTVHCANITWLARQGITNPADGDYHPYASVNRGAMLAFLFRLEHPRTPSPVCRSKPYRDVDTTNVFCGYIQWAKNTRLAFGYSDGTFRPDSAVTRGAMAAFLHRVVTGRQAQPCNTKPFADVSTTSQFCGVISWAKSADVTYGVGADSYGAGLSVTRQSMASFLRRVAGML